MDSSEEEYGGERWWGELLKNTLIIGGMRTSMRLWKGHDGNVEMMKLLDTEFKLQGKSIKKELEAFNNLKNTVVEEIANVIPKQEVLKKVVEKEASLASLDKEININKTQSKKLIELLDKIDNKEFIEKLRSGDTETLRDAEFIIKQGSFLNLAAKGLIDKVVSDPIKLEAHFKSQFPDKKVTETNLDLFKTTLNNYGKNIDLYFDNLNKAATGVDILKTKEGAKPIKEVSIEPAVAGRTKIEYASRTKKQIVGEYNKALDRYITKKFGIEISDKQRATIKEGFKLDETLKKDAIIDDMFRLEDRVNKLRTGTQKQVDIVKSKQSIQTLKERVPDVKTLESKIGEDPKLFWRVREGRQREIVENDKRVSERTATSELNSKQ